jgi:selenocysteine lyase/cysteine desulfurase
MQEAETLVDMRGMVVGADCEVPLLGGGRARYVYLDNAASTPALVAVKEALDRFMPFYSSVHRGTGFKSRLSTRAYDDAHEIVARFVGADTATNAVVFGKNSTEAINKVAHCLPDDAVVVCTSMEHHSNDLPWRDHARVVHVGVTPEGRLDEEDLDRKLGRLAGEVELVAVSGASNVTGYIQPVHRLARKAHDAGARILVDCAQLAPHRSIDMLADGHPEHLDFVVLSAHKMYAPYGTGALVGPREYFLRRGPDYSGGGTVKAVTLDHVHWHGMPDRGEAGSPNVPGAVAMAVAASTLMEIGMDRIARHEARLTAYALERLAEVPGIVLYGSSDPDEVEERVGVIPFNLEGVYHFLLTAILGYEGGIGARSGCFCAHPYVLSLLGLSPAEIESWRTRFVGGDESGLPGMVRMSFGLYSDEEDVDRMVEMLGRVAAGDYVGEYRKTPGLCMFVPEGYEDDMDGYFRIRGGPAAPRTPPGPFPARPGPSSRPS